MFGAVSRRSRRLVLVLGVMAAALLSANRADAATSCTISTTAVSFGAYNVFNAAVTDSTGTITWSCTANNVSVTITLSKGASTTFSPRTMTNGTDTLTYNLYTNAARSTIWGDGTGGTVTYTNSNTPKNTNVVLTIYGRITALQDVSGGSYADTVSAVINF